MARRLSARRRVCSYKQIGTEKDGPICSRVLPQQCRRLTGYIWIRGIVLYRVWSSVKVTRQYRIVRCCCRKDDQNGGYSLSLKFTCKQKVPKDLWVEAVLVTGWTWPFVSMLEIPAEKRCLKICFLNVAYEQATLEASSDIPVYIIMSFVVEYEKQ